MSIPDHAAVVHSGPIFTVYQRQQQMFDGSYATFEKARRPDSVFCIPVMEDHIAMASQKQPGYERYISFLGGRVDMGLDHEQTMREELMQEAGMNVKQLSLYKKYDYTFKVLYSQYFYIAKGCSIDRDPSFDAGGEDIELVYFSFDEFIEFIITKSNGELPFIIDILKMKCNGTLNKFKELLFS